MRIWDLAPERLCRQHLLGEHRELHGLWVILTKDKKGFARHPETARWRGKLAALYQRHESLAGEMARRGYRDRTPAAGSSLCRPWFFCSACPNIWPRERRWRC